jgi:hypothetical protein
MNNDSQLTNSAASPGGQHGNPAIGTDDQVLAQRITRQLEAQSMNPAVATQMRLNDMRAQAIATTRVRTFRWRAVPILGFSLALSTILACVLIVQATRQTRVGSDTEATALFEATFGDALPTFAEENPAVALMETAANPADTDEAILADDLEFYAWLAENSTHLGASSGSGS